MDLDDAVRLEGARRQAATQDVRRAAAARAADAEQAEEEMRRANAPHFERLCVAAAEFAQRVPNTCRPQKFPRGQIERRAAARKMRVWRLQSRVEYSSTKGGPDRRPGIYVATDGKLYLWPAHGRMKSATVFDADEAFVDICIRLMGAFIVALDKPG